MGTPIYMSPEQAEGRVDEIDHRTDQWALGCIAYELLAGRPPFMGENVASLLYQVVHQAPPPMVPKVPEVSPDLEQVLGVALAKRREDRFGSMTAFARAFESAAAGRPVTALAGTPAAAIAATAVAVLPEAPARAPAAIPQQTTFSTAAGEAVEPAERPARQGKRLILGGVAVALLLGGGAILAMRGQTPATPGAAVTPLPSLAPTPPPPPPPATTTTVPSPTPVPAQAEKTAEKTPAPQPALVTAPAARPRKEKSKKPRSQPAAGAPGSDPTVDSAQVRSPPPAAPPPEAQPAWPPPAQSPQLQQSQQFQPAWPPPPDNMQDLTAPPPKAKKKGLFKRIFGKDN
jgi:serine/threonine-protein kinase